MNLKTPNIHLRKLYFKMDHFRIILIGLERNMWTVSIDLQDAYLHIPIHTRHQKFLRFILQDGAQCQFTTLCFGLATAPCVITKTVLEIGAELGKRGFIIFQYLDNWLLVNKEKHLLQSQLEEMLQHVDSLGFIVNTEKSSMIPSKTFIPGSELQSAVRFRGSISGQISVFRTSFSQ